VTGVQTCALPISGLVERYGEEVQMTHPDHMVKVEDIDSVLRLEPLYPLTHNVSQKVLGKAIGQALDEAPELAEWHDPHLLKQHGWPAWKTALLAAHNPLELADISHTAPARVRLAYDELLSNQLALGLVRRGMRRSKGLATKGDGRRAQDCFGRPALRFNGQPN